MCFSPRGRERSGEGGNESGQTDLWQNCGATAAPAPPHEGPQENRCKPAAPAPPCEGPQGHPHERLVCNLEEAPELDLNKGQEKATPPAPAPPEPFVPVGLDRRQLRPKSDCDRSMLN